MKSILTIFTIIFLFFIYSCSPAKKDSQQNRQTPVIPQAQPQTITNETETPVVQENQSKDTTLVTINPPHGQPGHRCDIPVGAPLNSAPANTSRQITANPPANPATNLSNNSLAPTIENAQRLNSSQPRNTGTTQNSGRINPPHGQPGHRCDIPVGSPLP